MRLPAFIVPCLFIPWASPAQASAPAKAARVGLLAFQVQGAWSSRAPEGLPRFNVSGSGS